MNDERIDLYKQFEEINYIDPSYYEKFRVKRGLRNADGTGVLAGMTNISNVHGYLLSDGDKLPDEGSLRLRGYELTLRKADAARISVGDVRPGSSDPVDAEEQRLCAAHRAHDLCDAQEQYQAVAQAGAAAGEAANALESAQRAMQLSACPTRETLAQGRAALDALKGRKAEIDREALIGILEPAIWFALNFDLLMPPYEDNKRVTVDQFNTKMDNSKFVTGKRLGYDFDVEDI